MLRLTLRHLTLRLRLTGPSCTKFAHVISTHHGSPYVMVVVGFGGGLPGFWPANGMAGWGVSLGVICVPSITAEKINKLRLKVTYSTLRLSTYT